jgi:hypothetical protein
MVDASVGSRLQLTEGPYSPAVGGGAPGTYSPIRSYRYTLAMFPLPYMQNVLRYRSCKMWSAFPS